MAHTRSIQHPHRAIALWSTRLPHTRDGPPDNAGFHLVKDGNRLRQILWYTIGAPTVAVRR